MLKSGTFRAQEIWDLAVCSLKKRSDALYRQWFSQMTAVDIQDDLLTIGVPNDFFMDVVSDQYGDLIQHALDNINGRSYRFELRPGILPPAEIPSEKKVETTASAATVPAVPAMVALPSLRPLRVRVFPSPMVCSPVR